MGDAADDGSAMYERAAMRDAFQRSDEDNDDEVLTRCIQRCWVDRARLVHDTRVHRRQR